jgi:hypothetical protein
MEMNHKVESFRPKFGLRPNLVNNITDAGKDKINGNASTTQDNTNPLRNQPNHITSPPTLIMSLVTLTD